jgi:hypothetical protein
MPGMPFAAGKGFSGLAAILSGIQPGMWGKQAARAAFN